jgi:hypothetical protein
MAAHPSPRPRHPVTRRVVTVGACAAAAATLGVGTASASPDVTTTTNHATARIVDEENGLLLFINKSRADLCTPERIAFEAELVVWFEGGLVGDPPVEPADSSQGVVEVGQTSRLVDGREILKSDDEVPVEVWRLDDEGGGIDCTATDGAGAELFAAGTMNYTTTRRITDSTVSGSIRVAGTVMDTVGGRWNYSVRYLLKNAGGHDLQVQPIIRLVELG